MGVFAALDVSQEKTAICVVDADGTILGEGKVATCAEAISPWLKRRSQKLEKIGIMRRAEEIIAEELAMAPELRPVFEGLVAARHPGPHPKARRPAACGRPQEPHRPPVHDVAGHRTDHRARRRDRVRRRLAVPRSSCAGAYLGLTPKRYKSNETSQNGRISKRGDRMTRTCLDEAANAVMTRNIGASRLRDWALAVAKRTGPRKAKGALARKLAVMFHAMWRTGEPFQERIAA